MIFVKELYSSAFDIYYYANEEIFFHPGNDYQSFQGLTIFAKNILEPPTWPINFTFSPF